MMNNTNTFVMKEGGAGGGVDMLSDWPIHTVFKYIDPREWLRM